jgi:hypothetical protein
VENRDEAGEEIEDLRFSIEDFGNRADERDFRQSKIRRRFLQSKICSMSRISGSQKYGAGFSNRKSSIFNRKFAKEEIAREGDDHGESFFVYRISDCR